MRPSEDDLARMAAARGLNLDRSRLRLLLPEVQRILDAAEKVRELPVDSLLGPGETRIPAGEDESAPPRL